MRCKTFTSTPIHVPRFRKVEGESIHHPVIFSPPNVQAQTTATKFRFLVDFSTLSTPSLNATPQSERIQTQHSRYQEIIFRDMFFSQRKVFIALGVVAHWKSFPYSVSVCSKCNDCFKLVFRRSNCHICLSGRCLFLETKRQ